MSSHKLGSESATAQQPSSMQARSPQVIEEPMSGPASAWPSPRGLSGGSLFLQQSRAASPSAGVQFATSPAVQFEPDEGGKGPGQTEIDRVRSELAAAQSMLDDKASPLTAAERSALKSAIGDGKKKLDAYVSLANQGGARAGANAPLLIAGGAILADDATVVGVADDWLLIFVGIGLAAVWLFTSSRASDQQLGKAWGDVVTALKTVAAAGGTTLVLRIKGDQLRGNTTRLAEHLARLLALTSVGGVPSGEPPKNNNDDDPHWWTEIKAFLKNIGQAIKGASRKQVMRELMRKGKFTEAEILAIEKALGEAAKLMGQTKPPFLP